VGKDQHLNISVRNTSFTPQQLLSISQLRQLSEVVLVNDAELEGAQLQPREQLVLQLKVVPQHMGILCTLLMFDFGEHGLSFLIPKQMGSSTLSGTDSRKKNTDKENACVCIICFTLMHYA
jgi:hypothetical protein